VRITDVLRSNPLRSIRGPTLRTGARLPTAEFTLLSRSSPTGRTSDAEYLFFGLSSFVTQTSTYKRVVN